MRYNSATCHIITRFRHKSVFSFLWQLSTWHCPYLLLCAIWWWASCSGTAAAERRRLLHGAPAASVLCSSRSISPAPGRSAVNPLLRSIDGADRRTDAQLFHRPCSAYHRCKKNVFTFFILFTFVRFLRFLFSKRFFILKNVGKVQSGKKINKKHFQDNSNEIDLWFFCCMSNDLKCLPTNFYLLTMFDARLNGIFRAALKAISWASGVELNYTKKR